MADEKWAPQPYSDEEFLSFDRLKRAVMSRALDRAESMMGEEFPLSPERITELINDEWQRAKEAVRSSPGARSLCHFHAQTCLRYQWQRHACPYVVIQRQL